VHLADLHERLGIGYTPSLKDVSLVLLYSKKLRVNLNLMTYGKIAQDYVKLARAKELKRAHCKGLPLESPPYGPSRGI